MLRTIIISNNIDFIEEIINTMSENHLDFTIDGVSKNIQKAMKILNISYSDILIIVFLPPGEQRLC